MHIFVLLSLLYPYAAPFPLPIQPQYISSYGQGDNSLHIPTSYESAVMARRILHLTHLGTLSTNFPQQTKEDRPSDLQGVPIGLMDYISDCEFSGNPTILAISIATSFRNVAAGSNISLSLQWTPPYPPSSRIRLLLKPPYLSLDPARALPYSAANLPRFSLFGYLEKIEDQRAKELRIGECFTKIHPDAKYWLPGNPVHKSEWVRLVVTRVYWVGGFGDRAYIGWIPVEEWDAVTDKEWKDARLPGEKKGWKE